ncbi:MAG: hypothetical protein ACRD1W_09065, partial [Vicinamibacterales bacterium]
PVERAAHLLWIGWVLWFGVIESGITTNYLLLPVSFMLIAIAIDVNAIVRGGGTLVPPDRADFRVALVVSDDLKGGWTNRWASEYAHRIEGAAITKRGWLVGILWTSEPASAQAVRDAVLTSIYRAEYLQTHAAPTTLAEMLDQEGYAMARAGCTTPQLDDDDLAYTRSVIRPHLGATDRATVIACMFGDRAAAALGYPPQGLSDRAGLALALSSARLALSEGRAFAT